MRLEGKVALVTGGGTGIGAATAALFRREGADVVIMGRRSEPLVAVAHETGAVASPGDAGSAADVAVAVALATERFGGLDVVVANAGGSPPSPLLETDDAAWAAAIHNNLTTAFVTCRESLPALLERRGAIVIVSSLAAHFAGPGVVGYTTAKHGLIGLTRSLARDYGPRGVRVNAVSPAWVRTPMANRAMEASGAKYGLDQEGAYAFATSQVPLRRPGEPEEVATICLFLATPDSALLMGAVLLADGGAHIVDLPTLALEGARGVTAY
jgi:meso-butanediol dehydrogenase / (S,S)-butanediol dehydrogenase / diacetyl reductase